MSQAKNRNSNYPKTARPPKEAKPADGVLWVAATPIGNLGDASPRLRECFLRADLTFCEDTRRTRELVTALGIPLSERADATRWIRMDQNVEEHAAKQWLEALQNGAKGLLVTDAGSPGIQDPGSHLIGLCHAGGVRVEIVPGPSAVSAFWSVSGVLQKKISSFHFQGFFPRKLSDWRNIASGLQGMAGQGPAFVTWFESPHRMAEALGMIIETEGPEALVLVGKELTKLHEQLWVGEASEVRSQILEHNVTDGEKGEWIFGLWLSGEQTAPKSAEDWKKVLSWVVNHEHERVTPKEFSRDFSQVFGVSAKEVYSFLVTLKNKQS